MKMIVHQAPGMRLSVGFAPRFGHCFQEQLPVRVIAENRFAPISAIHQMINHPWIFHSQLARHAALPAGISILCQYSGPTRSRTDTFTTRSQSVAEEAGVRVFIGLNVFKPSDALTALLFNQRVKYPG